MIAVELAPEIEHIIQFTANMLKGSQRRVFMAEVAEQLCFGSPRLTETKFGFGRAAVQLGIHEKRTGLVCYGNYAPCGRQQSELSNPKLEEDIRSLVDPEGQADPRLRNTFVYTRITAKTVRKKLIDEKNWQDDQLPKERTISNILNRLGYKLRRVQKTKPQKKNPETDAIFENVRRVNEEASQREQTVRISIDCKATVNLGDFSRGGKARGATAIKALDHDMATKDKMIPFGILNLENDRLHIFYGNSYKTSDFVCDAIEAWWEEEKTDFPDADELVIFSDNGPESNSHRTQFLSRMVDFGIQTGLKIHPVYYPPYHSKYNPVERPWSSLENHWSGALLNTVQSVLEWTKTMTWKSMKPVVNFLDKVYHKGVRLNKVELAEIAPHIIRHADLPKWDITIVPYPVTS